MGTNYYYEPTWCKACNRGHDRLHIGKSSFGWCFSLHVIPWENLNTLEDWKMKWIESKDSRIVDEYGEAHTPLEMLEIITVREGRSSLDDFRYHDNHAVPGPNNLVRHRIGDHCIRHGEGTWDYMNGDFS